MKTAQDFILEIPVLKNSDDITKARQILRDGRLGEVYVVDGKPPPPRLYRHHGRVAGDCNEIECDG